MAYKNFEIKDLNLTTPKSSNISLENLSEKDKEEFIFLYNLYRELFTDYIIDVLNLDYYDNKMKTSEYGFKPVIEENMDIYQKFSSEKLKYFYIRNNFYIEKLTKQQVSFLKQKLKNEDKELDSEAKKFIEQTYKQVILEDLMQDGKECRVLFGPDNPRFLADNDSIVIGVRYDEFYGSDLDENEWFERFMKQKEFMNKTIEEMKRDFGKRKNEKVTIIMYDDNCVNINKKQEKINEGEER